MRIKHLKMICCLLLLFAPNGIKAQKIEAKYHLPQPVDSLFAYKLPYIIATDSGRNCVWDFSGLFLDSAEVIEVNYFAPFPEDSSCIGLHREGVNYYYTYARDTLWMSGYENSQTHIHYTPLVPTLRFPFIYGDSLSEAFVGEGQYCHHIPFMTNGQTSIKADAIGRLLLPELVLDTALRVHVTTKYSHTKTQIREERYQWFSCRYRYPLLEMVSIQSIADSDTASSASIYYYVQEKEDNDFIDPEDYNQEITDSLLTDVFYAPNPAYTDLQIHYTLTRSAQVYISLHYNGGISAYQSPLKQEEEGAHIISVNMGGLSIGNYVVYIHADDIVVSGDIIKL